MSSNTKCYILYGIGAICERMTGTWATVNPDLYASILCFTDSRPETWGTEFCGRPVISPDTICQYEYDKIIITTELYAEEVYRRLTEEYRIPSARIAIASPAMPKTSATDLITLSADSGSYSPISAAHNIDSAGPDRYRLYLERTHDIMEWSSRDWFIDEAVKVQTVHNAIILPLKVLSERQWQGGVCDESGRFVAGHIRTLDSSTTHGNISSAYPLPQDIAMVNETVIYGGFLSAHFGHMITESLGRLWYHLEHPDSDYRYVFLAQDIQPQFLDFIYMLGIQKERILILDKPMQFSAVIVPEQTAFLHHGGYREKALDIYDAIRDSVVPRDYEKIYLRRSGYDGRTINEKYFEEQFQSMGYHVIIPEQLSIREQVALMAGARKVACLNGTLPHHILFCQNGVEITILQRSTVVLPGQFWINQARQAHCTIIDVSLNFLPGSHGGPCFLLLPTLFWKRYMSDSGHHNEASATVGLRDFAAEIFAYMEQWAAAMARYPFYMWGPFSPLSCADLLTEWTFKLHAELIGEELGETEKQRLRSRLGVDWTD